MDSRNLERFFLNKVSLAEIVTELTQEVEDFQAARIKQGTSLHVYVTHDDFEFNVRNEHLKKLCEGYLSGELNKWHLEYISNVLLFSDAFSIETAEMVDIVFQLSTPEINSPITPSLVRSLVKSL